MDDDQCGVSRDDGGDHVHVCAFPAEHTDWEYDNSHQCVECDRIY